MVNPELKLMFMKFTMYITVSIFIGTRYSQDSVLLFLGNYSKYNHLEGLKEKFAMDALIALFIQRSFMYCFFIKLQY